MIRAARHRGPRARWPLALALALLAPLPGRAQAPVPDAAFPAGVEVVTVDVVVQNRAGEPLLDLRREDFTVSEDGAPQEIVAFEAVNRPADATAGAAPPFALRAASNQAGAQARGAHFVIVFDELHLEPAEAIRARAAVSRFLTAGVADGDHVALVGTGEGTRWSAQVPAGRDALLGVLQRLQGRRVRDSVRDVMSAYEAMRIDQDRDPLVTDEVMRRLLATGQIRRDVSLPREPADAASELPGWREETRALAAQVYARAASRAEQTLGILQRSLQALAGAGGRKSLLLVSGGLVQDPHLAAYRRVVSESRRANTAISFLDARGLSAAPSGLQADMGQPADLIDRSTGATLTERQEGGEGSEGLARDTGGLVVRNQNDLGTALTRIGADARAYYLVGYSPSNHAADGRFRRIEVKVAREGAVVRARRGYYARSPADNAPRAEARDAAIQRALDAPFDLADVPLRAAAQAFGDAGGGRTAVLFTVEADVRGLAFQDKDGKAHDTLETLLVVAQRDTGEFTRFDQQFEMALEPQTRERYAQTGFPITRELKLAPGPYQARVVARDGNSGRVGSVGHDFVVPPPSGLRLSSVVVSDRLREGAGAETRVPEPTARRSFAPAGVLHCRFEVYGAGRDASTGQPNLTAGLAVRRSDGRVLAAVPETALRPAADGTLARSVGVSLEGAPPGWYEVIAVVTDIAAGRTAESREPIRIEAAGGS